MGDHLHKEIISRIKMENRERFREREKELLEIFEKEKRAFYEQEKIKYHAKCERLQTAFKNEYEKQLQVKYTTTQDGLIQTHLTPGQFKE